MNDILLRLDINNDDHKLFANTLLENFFHTISDDALFEFMYTSTAGHRLKVKKRRLILFLTNPDFYFIVAYLLFNTSYN
jgi:hypothetical protein